tara:strand:+ start:164 stop:1063 length:900 start_codon:yes stop_codon:yes gene_type:complete
MKNIHIEHPEDCILTGNLSILDAFFMPFILSLKIDGAPAIVWGRNPASGNFFVGTKSVFNKRLIKINESHEDIDKNHSGVVASILHFCFRYLPHTNDIIQGDFIGFGDSFTREFTPNTITYKFVDSPSENIIIAPHTLYRAESDLRDAISSPLLTTLEGNSFCRFIQPKAYIREGVNKIKGVVNFAKSLSQTVSFVSDKEATVIKREINKYIREGLELSPERILDGKYTKLLELYMLTMRIKLEVLRLCRNDADFVSLIDNNRIDGEGYILHSQYGVFKLIDRSVFSHFNFTLNCVNRS